MLQNERKWIKKRFLRTLLRYKHRLIITITKCLGCWFSADVTASMLVDKNKSVSLRLKKTFLLILRKKTNKKTFFVILCLDVSTNNLQHTRFVISQAPSGQSLFLKGLCPIILSSLWTKSYGVTIYMKHLWQNFYMVLFL